MANPANTTAYVGNDGRLWVDVTEAKTLVAADSGYVQNVIYANGVVTLPATAVPGVWTIRNGGIAITSGGADGAKEDGNLISVDPVAGDTIIGFNVADGTSADGKQLNNTAATAKIGDEVTILSVAAANGPYLIGMKGVWAREA
jgi:hypothetical protein